MATFSDIETRAVNRAALIGRDYRGFNFELLCAEGDSVAAGANLMRDARRPQIVLTAPVGGSVARIERGARRRLVSLQIDADPRADVRTFSVPSRLDRTEVRALMQAAGAWAALRTRPFGNVPAADGEPAAVFVNAADAAAEIAPIVGQFADEFEHALRALAAISDAPLYLCHGPGFVPAFDGIDNLQCVAFDGDERAALPGTHINALCPIGFAGGEVWHIDYQEVIALGHVLRHGRPWLERVVALAGDAIERPRSLRVAPGAAVEPLLDGELAVDGARILVGSAVHGQVMHPGEAFLRAGQRRLTALRACADSATAAMAPIIPSEALEKWLPPGIYAVPLMRALQLGDVERARELGALELVEEDVAPLGRACVSRSDYGALLRQVLNRLEAGR